MNSYDSFWKNGYLPIGRVSAPSTVTALKAETQSLCDGRLAADHLMTSPDGHVRVALHLCHVSAPFREASLNPEVMQVVRHLFGEPPVVLTSLLFNKPPRVGLPLTLHQDLHYYPYLGDNDLITSWLALDEVDLRNGGVEYLPGSHRARHPHRETGEQQAFDIDPALVDVGALESVALQPGEAVVHHGLTVHRSAANLTGRPRSGLATLYIRGSVTVTADDFPYPQLKS